jgi:hypothetical protein
MHGSKYLGRNSVALISTAIGAFEIGVLAIGRLVIRCVAVDSAKFKSLEIQDPIVTRLRAPKSP